MSLFDILNVAGLVLALLFIPAVFVLVNISGGLFGSLMFLYLIGYASYIIYMTERRRKQQWEI